MAVACWVVAGLSLRRRGVVLGQFIGWTDLNLIAALKRFGLRPRRQTPLPWVAWRDISRMTRSPWNLVAAS
jgi:hypothetical protein